MKKNIENRKLRIGIWIVALLQEYETITLTELNDLWVNNTELNDGSLFSHQSFWNYLKYIRRLLGVGIECDRRTNSYYICTRDETNFQEWIMSCYSLQTLMDHSEEVRSRILFDHVPLGSSGSSLSANYFDQIVDAMEKMHPLWMRYQKFSDEEPYDCLVEPYCLKLSNHRWYMLGRKDHRDHLQTFALDRIQGLELQAEETFTLDPDFSAIGYFEDSLGVYAGTDAPAPCRIRLSVEGKTRLYLRTLPLHESQHETIYSPSASWFDYRMRPTIDVAMRILGMGPDVEVLEPADLRQQVAEMVRKMAERY